MKNKFTGRIEELCYQFGGKSLSLRIVSNAVEKRFVKMESANSPDLGSPREELLNSQPSGKEVLDQSSGVTSAAEKSLKGNLNASFTFDNFVEG